MRRVLGGVLVAVVLLWIPATAMAAGSPRLTGSGTVQGSLTAGSLLTVKLRVAQSQGWRHIQEIDVDLALRGSTIDQIVFTPTTSSLTVQGGTGPASLGQSAQLKSAFFRINPANVALTAKGPQLSLTLPMRVSIDAPPGARLTFTASAIPLATLGPKSLTPPVKSNSGFSWGTLGAAILAALLIGGVAGGAVGVRRRPAPRVSVYGHIQRRLEQERAKR